MDYQRMSVWYTDIISLNYMESLVGYTPPKKRYFFTHQDEGLWKYPHTF